MIAPVARMVSPSPRPRIRRHDSRISLLEHDLEKCRVIFVRGKREWRELGEIMLQHNDCAG